MRYVATIELLHLAQGDPLAEGGRAALERSAVNRFRRDNAGVAIEEARLSARSGGVFVLHATMAGQDLTSPLDALTRLDEAVLRALMTTGLFEEFDVARRRLEIGPG